MQFLDLLFPRKCLGCEKWGQYFCPSCLETLDLLKNHLCPVCCRPAIFGKTHPRCQKKSSLDGLASLFPYQSLVKTAVGKLKYKFVTDLADELITSIHRRIEVESQGCILNSDQFKKAVLVPVPLHPRRERERGFNQSALLGKLLAQKMGWRFEANVLKRTRYTKPQVKLKGKARKKNVKGVFKTIPEAINELASQPITSYFVFDDVWTTGSTLRECGAVLKKAGAKKVWGLTLAR